MVGIQHDFDESNKKSTSGSAVIGRETSSEAYKTWTPKDWMIKFINMRRNEEDMNSKLNSEGQTLLMCATKFADYKTMQQILNARDAQGYRLVNVDTQDDNGNTALTIATVIDDNEKMLLLLKNGADVELAKKGVSNKRKLKKLEDLYQEVFYANRDLMIAVGKEDFTQTQNLFQKNNFPMDEILEMKRIYKEINFNVKSVLENKPVNVNTKVKMSNEVIENSILLWAIAHNCKEIVKLLLKQPGIEVNIQGIKGDTALMLAVHKGYTDIVKLLLDRPIDVNIQNSEGSTALMIVIDRMLRSESLRKLYNTKELAPPDINYTMEQGKRMATTYNSYKEIVSMLLERKDIDVNLSDNEGNTVFMNVVVSRNKELIDLLFKKGALFDFVDFKNGMYDKILWMINELSLYEKTDISTYDEKYTVSQVIDILMSQEGFDINVRDDHGYTILMRMAFKGYFSAIKILLNRGADVNAQDNNGITALIFAVAEGDKEMVELFLDHGARVDILDNVGHTALEYAIHTDRVEIVKLLLKRYSLEELRFGLRTIMEVILKKTKEILDILLKYGIDVGVALSFAAYYGNEEMVRFLLEKNIDLNEKYLNGYTILMCAAESGNPRIVRLLLDQPGIDIGAKNENMETALDCAIRKGRRSIVRLILSKMGPQNSQFDLFQKDQRPPMDRIKKEFWETISRGDVNQFDSKFLNEEGEVLVDINAKDENGDTPLIIVSSNGNLIAVRWFLENRADLTLKDGKGDNAIIRAAKNGYFDVVEELLFQKANIINSTGQHNRTALMAAAENGHVRVVKLLLKKGAKVSINDSFDKTVMNIVENKIKEIGKMNTSYKEIKTVLEKQIELLNLSSNMSLNNNFEMNDFSWDVSITECEKDLKGWEKDDPNVYKKIQLLIEEIKRDPFRGLGQVERLSGDMEGMYSRRINKQNRLVYEVDGEKVILWSCKGHYEREKRKNNRIRTGSAS